MPTAWKVFRIYKGELCSVFARGKAKIKYIPGVKTTSPEWLQKERYFPLVFATKEAAENFEEAVENFARFAELNMTKYIILEVEVGEEVPLPIGCDPDFVSRGILFTVLSNNEWPSTWPKGTRMVKWVKVPEDFDLFQKELEKIL